MPHNHPVEEVAATLRRGLGRPADAVVMSQSGDVTGDFFVWLFVSTCLAEVSDKRFIGSGPGTANTACLTFREKIAMCRIDVVCPWVVVDSMQLHIE